MKKLSFLQAYEKHIEKVKKHWLTVTAVLAVWVLWTLWYQWYQDASYAKTIANRALLQDMGFVDTPIKVAPVKNIKDIITINEPIDTLLTWVYTWGDIIISAASFTQTLPNGTVWPVNTILSTGSNAPVTVNITFKNIGTMPLYIPNTSVGKSVYWGYMIYGWGNGWANTNVTSSILTQWDYLMPWWTIQWTLTINGSQFHNPYNPTTSPYITFTATSQQQQWRNPTQPSQYQNMLFESNGQNNSFTINYTVPSTSNPINTGVLEPIEIENPIWIVKKWFDLTIPLNSFSSNYNASSNELSYNFNIKNIWNKPYVTSNNSQFPPAFIFYRTRVQSANGTQIIMNESNILPSTNNNITVYIPQLTLSNIANQNTIPLNLTTKPYWYSANIWTTDLPNWTYDICNEFYIWTYPISWPNQLPNVLSNDINTSNNSTTYCTTFTKTNWNNPSTWSNGNTYGYGYGYQPGYGYGYGYGYMTKYANKSNFFYLTKPYMMISEKIYKVFKDQYTVMKKLKKGSVEKLFDRSTLKTMKTDVMKYLKKEINKAQNKTKGMREKIAEIQKISKLYTQFIKDYSKRISAKESTKTYIKPTDTKKESTKTYTKSTDTKKKITK